MSAASVWWLLAGSMIAIELLTGTFYLLMISAGLVAAALAAHAGLSETLQITVAALVGGGAVGVLHWRRKRHPVTLRATANKDVNLDIGETVHVAHWDDQHQTEVNYRGAQWAASLAPNSETQPGTYRIVEVLGSRLVLLSVGS